MEAKTTVFCVLAPCGSEVVRRFGITYRLHLQGRILSEARNKQKQAENWAVSKLHDVTTPKNSTLICIYLFVGYFTAHTNSQSLKLELWYNCILFIFNNVFNDLQNLDCIATNDRVVVNNELKIKCMELVVT
jgi:hypothetical protein